MGSAEDLNILAARSDHASWLRLVQRLDGRLRAYALRVCCDAHLAEDAVQEALILIRRDAWQFRPQRGTAAEDAQAEAWILGIVTHCCRAQVRSTRRRQERHRRAQAVHQGSTACPPDLIEQAETATLVRAAVAGLPAETCQAVSLRYFADLDYPTIAAVAGVSEAVIRQRVKRGLDRLRQRLARVGAVLGFMGLIRSLQAQEAATVVSRLPHLPSSLFPQEILTMPRLIAAAGLVAAASLGIVWLRAGETPPATTGPVITTPAVPPLEFRTRPPPEDPNLPAQARLITANTGFAVRIYQQVIADQKGDVVLGPHSISAALALAQAGAAGETKREMDATLGWTTLAGDLHPAWQSLRNELAQAKGIELAIANRLFLQRGAPFLDPYLTLCRDRHGAAPETCDFKKDPEAERQRINAWVGEQTRKRIPELLKPQPPVIHEDTRGILVNACYFKGGFIVPFKVQDTEAKAVFHAPEGDTTCALMRATCRLKIGGDERVDVVSLGYGQKREETAQLVLIVPKAVDGLAAVEKDLSAGRLSAWQAGMEPQMVDLSLPRFTSRTAVLLRKPLQKLEMKAAFDPKTADFTGMYRDPALYLNEVIHEAWVATDEAGSEAAAVTAVGMMSGAPPTPRIDRTLRIDRPFLWLITETRTGAVLFLGRVVKPQDPGPAKVARQKARLQFP